MVKLEGKQHPDRDAQFCFISDKVGQKGYPVISVDAKKKENIGQFKNNGKEWETKGEPTP
ncbi:MAG: ISAzo13 family transposase, partial [Desulfobacteraceae bacterium]|nr:ISAzo13 family transposase [Desulfobacteraceae bacterium]